MRARVRLRYQGGDQARPGRALEYLSGVRFPESAEEVEAAIVDQGEKPMVDVAVRYGLRHGLVPTRPWSEVRGG